VERGSIRVWVRGRSFVAASAAVLLFGGCTWVQLTAAGEQVQFANQKAVEGCQQVGKTTAHTKAKLWIFARDESTIREELRSLARNDAAVMGGTTVSPLGPAEDGEQTFGIYVCPGGG
jgi:hypothetical protein